MAVARILISGEAIRASGMSDFQYSKYGCILGFKYVLITYRHFVDTQRGISAGYYNYNEYLDYIATYDKVKPSTLIPFNFGNFKAKKGDLIRIYQRNISQNFLQVCWYTYEFPHVEDANYGEYKKIIVPNGYDTPLSDPHACDHVSTAKTFYNNYISKALSKNDKSFAEILADIEQQIEYIENNIFNSLITKPDYADYISRQRDLWEDIDVYNFFDTEKVTAKQQYGLYLSRLTSFVLYFQSYIKKIGNDSILVFLYLAAVMNPEAMKELPLDIKMKMLVRLALGDFDNWQLFFYNPEDDLSVVVKIVASINLDQVDAFLTDMLDEIKYSVVSNGKAINLFEKFYTKLENSNLKDFIYNMYYTWIVSNHNPYKSGVFVESNKYVYNKEHGVIPNKDFNQDPFNNPQYFLNFDAAPIVLNYTSTEFLGIYFDNFKFYFSKDIGGDSIENSNFQYEFNRSGVFGQSATYGGLDKIPKNKILAVKDSLGLYGSYSYYQPVALLDANQETKIKLPFVINNPKIPNGINNLIPIFVLKYIDDIGDRSDFDKSIGYFVDIATLFVGGIGFASKLKYISKLSLFSKEIIAGNELVITFTVELVASAAYDVLYLASTTISFLFKLTGDIYKNEPWYEDVRNFLTWAEILSGTASVLSGRLLRISAKNLVDSFNSLPKNEWPNQFLLDSRGVAAKKSLIDISKTAIGITDDLIPEVRKRIGKILEELWNKEKQGKFIRFGSNGVPIHTDEDIAEIVSIGYRGGLTEREISELIHISYRSDKIINTSQLILQIRYFIYVTKVKGYPAGFSSPEKYKDFCKELDSFWKQQFLEFSNTPGVNFTNINYELAIQGSVIRKRVPGDPLPPNVSASDFIGLDIPGDIEFIMLMESKDFETFIEQMNIFVRYAFKGDVKKSLLKKIKYARDNGNFSYVVFDKIDLDILINMRAKAKLSLTGIEGINFSITLKGSRLDLGPYLPFKYN